MLQIDSILIQTQKLEILTKYLVHLFEMEISCSGADFVELEFQGHSVRLVLAEQVVASSPILFRCDGLEEIEQMKDRAEFFYFTHPAAKPLGKIVDDQMSEGQLVSFFDPEGRKWDVLFFC